MTRALQRLKTDLKEEEEKKKFVAAAIPFLSKSNKECVKAKKVFTCQSNKYLNGKYKTEEVDDSFEDTVLELLSSSSRRNPMTAEESDEEDDEEKREALNQLLSQIETVASVPNQHRDVHVCDSSLSPCGNEGRGKKNGRSCPAESEPLLTI